jgi:hypothetical protein
MELNPIDEFGILLKILRNLEELKEFKNKF